jgi:predicted nucleic acid-binding Zn ribbon protein
VRRLAPRPLSAALEGVVGQAEPATLLARVQALWPEVAGAQSAARGAPVAERDGTVTVACESAVWAQEFELLAPDLLARFGAALGGAPGQPSGGSVKKLRFVVGSAPNQR